MSTTILTTIIAYFALLFGIARWTGKRADNATFFTGNRRSPWYVVAFAMIGAAMSGVTFVSVPGMVAAQDFSYMQMVLGFTVGYVLIALVLIPLFYRHNLTSIYEYLKTRFGVISYRTGAWFFFISHLLGASVKFYLVCAVLQFLVCAPLHIPFVVNVAVSMALVCFYTQQGGVRTLIWTDSLKTLCLIVSVGMCIYYIATDAGADFSAALHTPIFFFDDVNDKQYFFKQFVAGIFIVIAMTGLDQDMMQKVLSCKNPKDSQKNVLVSAVLQMGVIFLLLVLGALLYLFAASKNVALPVKSDDVFPMLATGGYFPPTVGILFIIGLISAAYASVGSSLTSLTTSLSVDILGAKDISPRQRKKHHAVLALLMGLIIIVVNLLNNSSVINVVFTLVSYSYGPILGIFAFGILTKCAVKDKWVPVVAVLSPLLCWIIDINSVQWLGGYKFSYELLMMNAAFMFFGMLVVRKSEL